MKPFTVPVCCGVWGVRLGVALVQGKDFTAALSWELWVPWFPLEAGAFPAIESQEGAERCVMD